MLNFQTFQKLQHWLSDLSKLSMMVTSIKLHTFMTVPVTLVEFKVTAIFERLKFCFFTMFLIFIKPSDIDTNINIMHICI